MIEDEVEFAEKVLGQLRQELEAAPQRRRLSAPTFTRYREPTLPARRHRPSRPIAQL